MPSKGDKKPKQYYVSSSVENILMRAVCEFINEEAPPDGTNITMKFTFTSYFDKSKIIMFKAEACKIDSLL